MSKGKEVGYRVDVGYCKVWSDDLGLVAVGYEDSTSIVFPEDEVIDMLKALSTWYRMGRTEEVVIRDE